LKHDKSAAHQTRIKGQELIAALRKAGFEVIRIKGSHHLLRHPDGRCTVVPVHRGETIGLGLMSKILRDCEITRDELAERL
jgi:predicted RNA binding protein YcfA (HicA-like mRNA interferase family)